MVKKLRFGLQFTTKLVSRYWKMILTGLVIGSGLFLLITNVANLANRYIPKTTYIGTVGNYRLNNMPSKISHLISYGLTDIMPNNRATSSAIVSNWTVGNEGKEYTFYLKENLKWQDKTAVKPEQIDYQIEGAEFISGENSVKINLESPFAPFPTLLNEPLFKNNKIGLGMYKIKRIKTQAGVISSLLLTNTENSKEQLLIKFYPSESDLLTAFKIGEIDEAWEISDVEKLKKWDNIEIKSENSSAEIYAAAFFNTRKPPFENKRLRQALAYCLEKPSQKDRAISPISPSSWAYNENVKKYEYDPDHGRELFKEGWDPAEKLSFKILTVPELLDWAEKTQIDWQKNLNLDVKIQVTNFIPESNDFDVFLGYGIIPPDPDQYIFWHSTQPSNLTGISNPKIDQLLEEGRKTIDYQERREIYFDFQQTLSEESPVIFLFYPQTFTINRQ